MSIIRKIRWWIWPAWGRPRFMVRDFLALRPGACVTTINEILKDMYPPSECEDLRMRKNPFIAFLARKDKP